MEVACRVRPRGLCQCPLGRARSRTEYLCSLRRGRKYILRCGDCSDKYAANDCGAFGHTRRQERARPARGELFSYLTPWHGSQGMMAIASAAPGTARPGRSYGYWQANRGFQLGPRWLLEAAMLDLEELEAAGLAWPWIRRNLKITTWRPWARIQLETAARSTGRNLSPGEGLTFSACRQVGGGSARP